MLIRLLHVLAEILRAVAVDLRIRKLDLIQNIAHLRGRHGRVRQKIDKIVERALEINVVLPERVVRIENEPAHSMPESPWAWPLRGAISFTCWMRRCFTR